MSNIRSSPVVTIRQRQRALGRWENEGGAATCGPLDLAASLNNETSLPDQGKAELLNLHVRVVALENLVLALLAAASDRQLAIAGAMPAFIAPRPGKTAHPLTILAAGHMTDLVERAHRFAGEVPENKQV
jgi:hypothetical protein